MTYFVYIIYSINSLQTFCNVSLQNKSILRYLYCMVFMDTFEYLAIDFIFYYLIVVTAQATIRPEKEADGYYSSPSK